LNIQPECENFWQFVKKLQHNGYTVAMHGYNHVCTRNNAEGRGKLSEFADLPLEVQIDKIRRGKELLTQHGIDTDVFFAPRHSYDDNTIRALQLCGFKYMSDGKSFKPYKRHGVICLPCRSSGMPNFRGFGIHTAVFHAHEWAYEHKKYGYTHLKKLVEKHRQDIITFDEYKSKPIGNSFIQRIDEQIFLLWQLYIRPIVSKAVRLFK
jgi:predicted deacetylase